MERIEHCADATRQRTKLHPVAQGSSVPPSDRHNGKEGVNAPDSRAWVLCLRLQKTHWRSAVAGDADFNAGPRASRVVASTVPLFPQVTLPNKVLPN